jgi:hypothetical protein
MKNVVFLGVTSCSFCKNLRLEGSYSVRDQGEQNQPARNNIGS